MKEKQLKDAKVILGDLSARHCLVITANSQSEVSGAVKALYCYKTSGFLTNIETFGAKFSAGAWPFLSNIFELIVLENVFEEDYKRTISILKEAERMMSEDGQILIVQNGKASIKWINQFLLKRRFKKSICYYYDSFVFYQVRSWVSHLIPEIYSKSFTICCNQKHIPMTPVLEQAKKLRASQGKYAVGANKVFSKESRHVL